MKTTENNNPLIATPITDKLDEDMVNLSNNGEDDYRLMMRHARDMERQMYQARTEAEGWRDNWKNKRSMSMIAGKTLPWER